MMTIQKTCLCILLIAMATSIARAQASGISSGYPTPKNGFSASEQRGHGLYLRYCVYCHGVFGDGNGDTAPFIDPKPRDFTIATFKCRSTPTGTLPLDSDLFDTIVRGVETTNMPSWRPLSDENRHDLIAYIKTFSERWKTEKPGEPIKIPPEPAVDIASIRHGHELFQKMECWKCHGQQGHGDGPSASTLTDSKDQPIHPYNFAAAGNDARFKCGVTNQDLYRIFMTGLDGTPMPSFADVIQPNDAWDLVHYLRTLQTGRRSKENEVLKAAGGPAALKSAGDKPSANNLPAASGENKSPGGAN
ncbi:MAG: cytochrome c [Terriglobales bacterium]